MTQKTKRLLLLFAFLLSVILIQAGVMVSEPRARAQEPAKPKEQKKVDQHWRIVPDVAPVDLQRQLEILNKEGFEVTQSQIVLVGDKLTIMISDGSDPEEDEIGN